MSNVGRRRRKGKAIGLFGGGLDSLLAFRWMSEAGVPVEGVHFDTGFARPAHRARADAASERGEVTVIDVRQRYLEEVVANPRFGYGSGMNPCHDCRAFMLARANEFARRREVDLLFTGDVVGQRAHDQSHRAFEIAERESGTTGRVFRPLSAAHLAAPRGAPEVEGDGSSSRLQGRSRRTQLELAERWNVDSFPTPSGRCCRLAEPEFARRVRDYLEHRRAGELRADEIPLLGWGRHFRLGWNLKVVLARNAEEAGRIEEAAAGLGRCGPAGRPGPQGWIDGVSSGDATDNDIAALVASHMPGAGYSRLDVRIDSEGRERVVSARPAGRETVERWRI